MVMEGIGDWIRGLLGTLTGNIFSFTDTSPMAKMRRREEGAVEDYNDRNLKYSGNKVTRTDYDNAIDIAKDISHNKNPFELSEDDVEFLNTIGSNNRKVKMPPFNTLADSAWQVSNFANAIAPERFTKYYNKYSNTVDKYTVTNPRNNKKEYGTVDPAVIQDLIRTSNNRDEAYLRLALGMIETRLKKENHYNKVNKELYDSGYYLPHTQISNWLIGPPNNFTNSELKKFYSALNDPNYKDRDIILKRGIDKFSLQLKKSEFPEDHFSMIHRMKDLNRINSAARYKLPNGKTIRYKNLIDLWSRELRNNPYFKSKVEERFKH